MVLVKNTLGGALFFAKGPANFFMMPGINRISDKVWSKLAPESAELIEQGIIEVTKIEASDGLDSLKSMADKAALALIADTLDRSLLGTWKANEKRPKVSAAIDKQLAAVQMSPEEVRAALDGA